jgi:hypothetical protein
MERNAQVILSPFDFPDVDDPKSAGKPRFDARVAMIEAAHEHAALLRFLACKAEEELLASDETELPKHIIKLGPGRGRAASLAAVSAIVGKLNGEADDWDRVGREMFRQLPKRVAARLTLPDKERGVAIVVSVSSSALPSEKRPSSTSRT